MDEHCFKVDFLAGEDIDLLADLPELDDNSSRCPVLREESFTNEEGKTYRIGDPFFDMNGEYRGDIMYFFNMSIGDGFVCVRLRHGFMTDWYSI